MQSVAHMSHAARTESIKLAQWSQVDRSGYYDDARVWEQVKVSILICASALTKTCMKLTIALYFS